MPRREGGFTIVEVMVAVMVLAVGVLALAGSSAAVSRMLGRGKTATLAANVGLDQMERLRAYAEATDPPCGSARFASSPGVQARQGMSLVWVVPALGQLRDVEVRVSYRTPGGLRTDTLRTRIRCY
ncbi:MAG TPA: prepilin-type N-terminal cleavage/methylation domain-containing protein [Gemmatimonadales bacterium]|nr:prepilin-type N-terminal cleavage/methylation domain-containing protein [Gemmatimonadales bacterium]